MGAKTKVLALVLLVCTLGLSETVNKTAKKDVDNFNYVEDDYVDQEVLFNEDKPCPRDCICTLSQGYRTAKCNRLEVGTQKFGDDINDLFIENADPRFPIELDDFIFKKLGLHMVATIKIVNSTISAVGVNAFHGLHELYAVDLSNNKINYIHPETFANNKMLLLLSLANNPLQFPALGSKDYFLNASSVQELDISYCNIKYLTPNTFQKMTDLIYLNVVGNSLTDLDANTFKNLLDLEELDLSDNNIRSLPDDIFAKNNELATLHIQRNPIDTVYGLQISDLLTLNAGQTMIKFVGPSTLNGMTHVSNLNLSGNGIMKIHNQAFHSLVELNYLDLSYNNLDFISNILIKENIELDIFKISNNPNLTHLPENGFECATEQFNIYLFDASYCGLEEIYDNSLSTFVDLTQINLSGNKIKEVSVKVFSRSPKLVEINLAYNLLATLDSKVFENNKELSKLNLQGNPIKTLSAGVFAHTTILTWLDLSHTELTSLWKDNKNKSLSNLSYLNISHCRITEIKQNEIEGLTTLRTLDITNNPLACSRDFEDLISWLTKRNVSPRANHASIANLQRKENAEEQDEYSWEFLSRKACGSSLPHPVEILPPVSEEEVWETKDSEGDFDLKATLADNTLDAKSKIDDVQEDNNVDDDDEEDVNDDGDDGDDGDEADDEGDDADDDDDAAEDYDEQDDVQLKVKLVEKPQTPKKSSVDVIDDDDKIKLNYKLMDGSSWYDDLEKDTVAILESVTEEQRGYYDYIWPIVIAVLGVILLLLIIAKLVMLACSRKSQQVRYNSAIIAAMGQHGRTKKDCGLVYQQLSEELGPATPKLARYQPLQTITVNATNMSYESSPFHHSNIVPEAV